MTSSKAPKFAPRPTGKQYKASEHRLEALSDRRFVPQVSGGRRRSTAPLDTDRNDR